MKVDHSTVDKIFNTGCFIWDIRKATSRVIKLNKQEDHIMKGHRDDHPRLKVEEVAETLFPVLNPNQRVEFAKALEVLVRSVEARIGVPEQENDTAFVQALEAVAHAAARVVRWMEDCGIITMTNGGTELRQTIAALNALPLDHNSIGESMKIRSVLAEDDKTTSHHQV